MIAAAGCGEETVAFRMRINPGAETEYQRRHDLLWPELREALLDAGIRDYRIFLDEESGLLFAVMRLHTDHTVAALAELPVMRRWWAMMSDIMQVEPDRSPTTYDLKPVFILRARLTYTCPFSPGAA